MSIWASAYSSGNCVDTGPDCDLGPARASIRQQLPPGIAYRLADDPPFPERADFQPTRYTRHGRAYTLAVKHLDNFADLCPDLIAPSLGLPSLVLHMAQSNFPAQFREARIDDGFGHAET